MLQKQNCKNLKNGFTLAEVLLTLAIVGIVAAVTVPSLMADIQSADTVARLKKAQSVMQEAVKLSMLADGVSELSQGNTTSPGSLWYRIAPYLSFSKNCGYQTFASDQDCFPNNYKFLNPAVTTAFYCGTGGDTTDLNISSGILNDGTKVIMHTTGTGWSRNRTSNPRLASKFSHVLVDLNGHKGPNQVGRDIFEFMILNDGTVLPGGALDDYFYECNKTGTRDDGDGCAGVGYGCTYKVLKEGKINY